MALIPDKSISLVQLRVKNEEFNNKSYIAMSNWLMLKGYEGASKLWKKYAEDELVHKGWAVEFLSNLNILPIEQGQEQPQTEFKGLPQIIALSYQRELQTTKESQELAKVSLEEGDFLTFTLAQKYVTEQIEEMNKVQFLVDLLNIYGDDKLALQLLDQKLGELAG